MTFNVTATQLHKIHDLTFQHNCANRCLLGNANTKNITY